MKKFFVFFLIFLIYSNNIFSLPKPQKIKRLLEYAASQIKDVSGTADITTLTYGKERIKKIKYCAKQPNKMYVEYTYPKEMKGAKIICDGKTIWRYYPSLKKWYSLNLKSSTSKKGKTIDKELGMIANLVATDIKDFWEKNEIIVLGEEKIENKNTYVVELKQKEEINRDLKSQQKLWIEKDTGLTLKIEFTFLDAKETIVFHYEKFNSGIPDSLFVVKEEGK
jgi:outer membrane lipoprotein-sorting protein